MRQVSHKRLIKKLLPIVRATGELILEFYRRGLATVSYKSNTSPVTEADLAAHHLLVQQLANIQPNYKVVSEEDQLSLEYRRADGCYWLIDPLDGTKEFIACSGEFTVNIALIEEGRCTLGVVFAPVLNALYWGGAGLGAFRCIGGETVPIKVCASEIDQKYRVIASKSHLNKLTKKIIHRLGEVELIQVGSSLKFCRLAEGAADIYPRLAPPCEWDTAAGQAVLEGAGGMVVDLQGMDLRYGKVNLLNPSFIAARDKALIPHD
jgi:3'(2'), 5'-bisphosphate nucleotidase